MAHNMTTDEMRAELEQLKTRDLAHRAALQVLHQGSRALRRSLRDFAVSYEELSIAPTVPDATRALIRSALLPIARAPAS